VTQLVEFIRAWQPQAPDRSLQPLAGDYSRGQSIFNNVCAICHGANGAGTDRAPALNDAAKLSQFDDAWYKSTIQQGRPDKGMPTWGTVLSPQQIADVLTVIDKWRANPAAAITSTPVPTSTTAPTTTVEVARPSNPGEAGPAVKLKGDATSGAQIFAADCQKCHGDKGTGGVQNPGSDDGTVPPLNPIDDTLISSDPPTYAYNLDLFLEHGSTPAGPNPQLKMPAWGDEKKLTPQQIADVIAYVESLNPAPPPAATVTPTPAPTEVPTTTAEIARPSNPGDAGPAASLTGDATSGAQIYVTNCQKCHGDKGVGGVANPGSDDGTVPPLNPIDDTLISSDPHTYAYNLDLFLEHGSTPAGTNPQLKMPAWGDDKKLTPQQIADVIAYVESLNPAPAPTPEAARPSNPGGPGSAIDLTGDPQSGTQL
ncbi:MAG TPA: c-type cytochrome, partial [Anaerolineae bacterium]|nr:c-type cytochrome [Anaerolineae bacterium]